MCLVAGQGGGGKGILLTGLMPLLITLVLIFRIVGGTLILGPQLTPHEAYQSPGPTVPVAE